MKLRKWIAIVLALMLLAGALPVQALADTEGECRATGGKHKWSKWKTVEAATCVSPGLEIRTCSACGMQDSRDITKGKHSYGKWQTTKKATCTKNGEQVRTCKLCGHEDTRKTDKAPHDYSAWKVIKEATCASTGSRKRTCSNCGREDTQTIEKKPHTWGEWEIIVQATDHSTGTRAHTCQVCGEQETEDYEPEGTLHRGDRGDEVRELQQGLICYGVLNPGGADGSYGPGTENAIKRVQEAEGLTADGIAWPQTLALLGHRFGEWEIISELSDFSMGLKQRTCSRCGYVEKVEEWPSPIYRRGDHGDGVKAMQEALNSKGYDCGRPDGSFGGRTERAVSGFESANGIQADGIAWPGVLKLLGTLTGGDDTQDDEQDTTDDTGSDIKSMAPRALYVPTVEVVKTASASADSKGYVEGEIIHYTIAVYNETDDELNDVEIYDPLKGTNEDSLVQMIPSIAPHSSGEGSFDYEVTKQNVEDGYVENTATVQWIDFNGHKELNTNTLTLLTYAPEEEPVVVIKAVENMPERGFFMKDEVIDFSITVINNSEANLMNVRVTDPLSDEMGNMVDFFPSIPAGESRTTHLFYTVTEMDIGPYIVNDAYASYIDNRGNAGTVPSNHVIVPTGRLVGAEVTKKVTNKPKNKKYYVLNEVITYDIIVHNYGDTDLNDVIVYDTLQGGTGEIGSIEILHAGETRVYHFSHVVTNSDVGHKKVINQAWIEWIYHREKQEAWSEPVIVPTGEPKKAEPEDCCVRTLIGLGTDDAVGIAKYTLDYCHVHKPVADDVAAHIDAAKDDAAKLEAWQYAVQAWTDALNREYDGVLAEAATEEEKAIIQNEKDLFFADMARWQDALGLEYPDDGVLVTMLVSEQLMNKTADLCYEHHTAPNARVDSLSHRHLELEPIEAGPECARAVDATKTGAKYIENLCETHRMAWAIVMQAVEAAETDEALADAWQRAKQVWTVELYGVTAKRYLAADAKGREIIAAEKLAWDVWLKAREGFLNLLYPGQPWTVNEVIAQTIRERVMDLCQKAE